MERRTFLRNTSFTLGALSLLNQKSFASFMQQNPWKMKMIRNDIGVFTEKGGTIAYLTSKKGIVVVDSEFPEQSQHLIDELKKQNNPSFDLLMNTHHHGDHAYGNQVWVDNGATPVAHLGVLEEMKKYETGYYGGKPGRWEDSARSRKDVAASRLKPPTLLYRTEMIFNDGKHRVELLHFGVAHTHGDGFAWLPKEKILIEADAYNPPEANAPPPPSISPLFVTLFDNIQRLKLDVDQIAPFHGRIVTMTDLRAAVGKQSASN